MLFNSHFASATIRQDPTAIERVGGLQIPFLTWHGVDSVKL
jgi:hypothetical protein